MRVLNRGPCEMLSALKAERLQHSVCQEMRPAKKGQF